MSTEGEHIKCKHSVRWRFSVTVRRSFLNQDFYVLKMCQSTMSLKVIRHESEFRARREIFHQKGKRRKLNRKEEG